MILDFDGPPERWVARGGMPAACLPYGGMPSYESDTGALRVYERCRCFADNRIDIYGNFAGGQVQFLILPDSYGKFAMKTRGSMEGGLGPIHEHDDAVWSWRPLLYQIRHDMTVSRRGSQEELEWRFGLVIEVLAQMAGKPSPREEANRKAEATLLEHLNNYQRFQYEVAHYFDVEGEINKLYRIRWGNGVEVIHPITHQCQLSLCFHPEQWMPHEDVMLSTKLLIESGKVGEQQMLEIARASPVAPPRRRQPTREERYAAKLEAELRRAA